jgi:hypothetical protein
VGAKPPKKSPKIKYVEAVSEEFVNQLPAFDTRNTPTKIVVLILIYNPTLCILLSKPKKEVAKYV